MFASFDRGQYLTAMKRSLLMFFGLVALLAVRGQCDSVYRQVDEPAHFKDGQVALIRWSNKHLHPVLNFCNGLDSVMITGLVMDLTINAKGRVTNVEVTARTSDQAAFTESCRNRLVKLFMGMEGWVPAVRRAKAVCGYYKLEVGCILWEEE